jgi:hypothetical protein
MALPLQLLGREGIVVGDRPTDESGQALSSCGYGRSPARHAVGQNGASTSEVKSNA